MMVMMMMTTIKELSRHKLFLVLHALRRICVEIWTDPFNPRLRRR